MWFWSWLYIWKQQKVLIRTYDLSLTNILHTTINWKCWNTNIQNETSLSVNLAINNIRNHSEYNWIHGKTVTSDKFKTCLEMRGQFLRRVPRVLLHLVYCTRKFWNLNKYQHSTSSYWEKGEYSESDNEKASL